jgi:Rrf2 family transcriptional regulator, iron-sulfur cluster assembly transcription factor
MYMLYSKSSEYVVRALVYLALQDNNEYIMIKTISEYTDIPLPFLSKIFQDIAKANWILSKKGKNGGVKLAVNPAKLKLIDIISYFDGSKDYSKCMFGQKDCGVSNRCVLHNKCSDLKNEIHDFLGKTTISDFSKIWKDENKRLQKNHHIINILN